MSTNYYVHVDTCSKCNRYDKFHIGKSSAGWSFSFHGEREEETGRTPMGKAIVSFEDWKPFLKHGKIFNEYGEGVPYDEFVMFVEAGVGQRNHAKDFSSKPHNWVDDKGYSFSEGVWS